MSTVSDLNLLDFYVNNLSGSLWEGQFKSHPCNLGSSSPIYQARTVSVLPVPISGSDSPSQAVFSPCKPSGTLQVSQAEKILEWWKGSPQRGAVRSLWQVLLAQDPPRLQPTSCLGLWQWRGTASSLQESLHQQSCQLLWTIFFHVPKLPTAMHGCSY